MKTVVVILAPCALAIGAFAIRSMERCRAFAGDGASLTSPAVEWLLAAVTGLTGATGDPAAAVVAWAPPVIAASTVIACYGITQHYFDTRVAFLASALVAILPANVWFSQVGCADHHWAVAFITTLLLGSGTALLGQDQETERPTSGCLGRAAFLGVGIVVSLVVWPGTMPLVGVIQLAHAVRVVTAPSPASAVGWARNVAVAHGIAAALLVPFALLGELGVYAAWVGLCALAFAGVGELFDRGLAAGTVQSRGLAVLAGAVACIGLALMALSGSGDGSPGESVRAGSVPLAGAAVLFSRFVYVAPLALALVIWDHRETMTASLWLLVGWAVFLCLAALLGDRLTSSASVAYSMLLAAALDAAFRHGVWRAAWSTPARAGALVLFGVAVVWALSPSIVVD